VTRRGIALRLANDETPIFADEKGVGHRAAGIDAHDLYDGSPLHIDSSRLSGSASRTCPATAMASARQPGCDKSFGQKQ
jgi:hypothetical protein